ncbi:unnamed protein product [Orchesella dallaii]|uniref:Uncharacterized protein n=1 Tax=Orchesella dallaii TaxID=48710 RepID=A0ABP1PQ45_9HEXA
MGSQSLDYGGAVNAIGDAKILLDTAITKWITDAELREEELRRREQELSIRETDLHAREKLVEEKEKSFSAIDRVEERDRRKVEHLNQLCKTLDYTTIIVEVGKQQILQDKKNHRKQMDEAIAKIKQDTEQQREEIFSNIIQEVEALRLPSANICFKEETAAVNKLISEIKIAGNNCLDFGIKNKICLTREDISRCRE